MSYFVYPSHNFVMYQMDNKFNLKGLNSGYADYALVIAFMISCLVTAKEVAMKIIIQLLHIYTYIN